MPSIFTLSGVDGLAAPKPKKAKTKKPPPPVGTCKPVYNGRTKRTIDLCYVGKGTGKGQTRSGWIFKKRKG